MESFSVYEMEGLCIEQRVLDTLTRIPTPLIGVTVENMKKTKMMYQSEILNSKLQKNRKKLI